MGVYGTPTFFDDRQGVKGLEALHARIKYEVVNGTASLRQPQLGLVPFDSERLLKVALKLRSLHPDLAPEEAERRLPSALIEQLVARVTEGFHGDVGVVPRQSRAMTETVADQMRDDSIEVFVHHGSVSKEERQAAEERFTTGTNACIVATSTLELGIDVGGLDLTFQANSPSTVSSFLQRMGRTGRREGTVANMTFLCDDTVYVVQNTALVLLAARGWVERASRSMPAAGLSSCTSSSP